MSEAPDQDDKTEDATQKKLDDALRRGETIYSQEATTWLVLASSAGALGMLSGPASDQLTALGAGVLAQAHVLPMDPASLMRLAGNVALASFLSVALAFLAFGLAGVAGRYLQDRPSFTAKRLEPKLEKLDPIAGFKRTFGPAAFGNFLKGLFKFAVVAAAVAWALWPRDASYTEMSLLDVSALLPLALEKALLLLIACLIAFGVLAGADYFFTRQSFLKRQRMTREEVKREFKESDGDPHLKAKVRQIRAERARRRMMSQVPGATVVVTNPTHFSVALKYDPTSGSAPVCVAKGADEIALRIRQVAQENDVPLVEDAPLARALYATANLDAPIPREQYEAVAKVIGVVMSLAARRRRRPG